jgi:hypothetical protein
MSFISRIFYGGTDIAFCIYLFFVPQIPGTDILLFFMFGRAAMTLAGAYIPPYTIESKVFYGGSDLLMGLFLIFNSVALGALAGSFGEFLLFRGMLTWANIEI